MIFKSKLCTVCDVFSKMGNKIVHIFKPFTVNNERSHLILPKKMTSASLCRNFNSDYLSCDCGLRWIPGFFRSSSARLGDETLCAYPRSLRGKLLRGLKEGQLSCGESMARMTHE